MDDDNNLHCSAITIDNGGEYYCYGYNPFKKVYFLSRVFLVVIGKIIIPITFVRYSCISSELQVSIEMYHHTVNCFMYTYFADHLLKKQHTNL